LFDTAVAATTQEEADATLRRVLEARRQKAQDEVNAMEEALALLPKDAENETKTTLS
jgi:hypothetical protein